MAWCSGRGASEAGPLPFRIASVCPLLGQPLVADGPKFVEARRPLPAKEECCEDDSDGRTAQNQQEPDGHGAIVADSANVRNLTTTEQ